MPEVQSIDPCFPSPCGSNAICNNGLCTCLPEYQGDPYVGCRPECIINDECARNKACIKYKCVDPCPGTCGENAICDVYNHIPMCRCPEGLSGNAFIECRPNQSNFQKLISNSNMFYIYFYIIISSCGPRLL